MLCVDPSLPNGLGLDLGGAVPESVTSLSESVMLLSESVTSVQESVTLVPRHTVTASCEPFGMAQLGMAIRLVLYIVEWDSRITSN